MSFCHTWELNRRSFAGDVPAAAVMHVCLGISVRVVSDGTAEVCVTPTPRTPVVPTYTMSRITLYFFFFQARDVSPVQ